MASLLFEVRLAAADGLLARGLACVPLATCDCGLISFLGSFAKKNKSPP